MMRRHAGSDVREGAFCAILIQTARNLLNLKRRDVRVVEGARLESVCRGNSTVGSNPTLSAKSCRLFSEGYSPQTISACNGVSVGHQGLTQSLLQARKSTRSP